MQRASTGRDRLALHRPQARERLSRAEDRRGSGGVDVGPGKRRDAREMAEEVERRPFGAQHRPGVAANQRGAVPDADAIAVGGLAVDLDGGPVLVAGGLEYGDRGVKPRKDTVLFDDELGLARRALGDRRA